MNSTAIMDDSEQSEEYAGALLASVREKKGYSREYVAGKLHLRTKIIELLEEDAYSQLPQPVFIKGYIHSYAKLLEISSDPFLAAFNKRFSLEAKPHHTLWQSRRESRHGETAVRWITGFIVLTALLATAWWWQSNKEPQPGFASKDPKSSQSSKTSPETRMTDLSRLKSLFSADPANPGGDVN